MALQDSVRQSLEQRLAWLKNYVNTIRKAVEELPAHDQEIAEIEAALKNADDGKDVSVAVAARPKPKVDSRDKLSQESTDVEAKEADAASAESAKP